jgi:heme exporter protein A
VRTLSQGQRRRVALARLALDLKTAGEPGIWILDEPFDALDTRGTELLEGLLSAHARRGGCVVLTSHLPLALRDPQPIVVRLEAPRRVLGTRAPDRATATAA